MSQSDPRPKCPRLNPKCAGRLDYREDPERFVCDACLRVWSLTDIAILTGRRAS